MYDLALAAESGGTDVQGGGSNMNPQNEEEIVIKPIGIIHTPYKTTKEIPCQGYRSKEIGEIEVFGEYEEGLTDIEGFSHLIILYLFHGSKHYTLLVKPFLDHRLRGLFTTRTPKRINPIGLSVVKLIERKGNVLKITEIDILDATPLIDIKPYVPQFDERKDVRIGWLEGKLK